MAEDVKVMNTVAGWPEETAKCRPVPMRNMRISGFLGKRLEKNLDSVLAALDSPIPKRFEARAKGDEPTTQTDRLASDSDLYKWLEGACYVYAQTGDVRVKEAIDHMAECIAFCQCEDGYINTQVPPHGRFEPKISHDLYIAGHFFEAAVAHYRVTQERSLLDAACRWADYLIGEFDAGNPYFGEVGRREHPEYELALVRLARTSGEKKYLDFAVTLARLCDIGPTLSEVQAGGGKLHAVRVNYLLAGLADAYLETGDAELRRFLPELWDEIVNTRLYITGGLGYDERIPGRPYCLPQSLDDAPTRDIAETCASVSLIMFSWRMHAASADSRFFDLIECVLYNHFLGALELDHRGTFYYNPLRLVGDQTGRTDHQAPRTRRLRLPEIHRTACCMPNAWRFLGALPEYVCSYDDSGLYVNLYTSGEITHDFGDGHQVRFSVATDYPHNGKVTFRFDGEQAAQCALRLRIPAWCRQAAVVCTGEESVKAEPGTYHTIERMWTSGDEVTLTLDMPVRMVFSDPRIAANAGQVAFAKGPLVYCLENCDVDFPVEAARVTVGPSDVARAVEVAWRADLLEGVHVLSVPGCIAPAMEGEGAYTAGNALGQATTLTLIPYYARANRGEENRWVTFLPLSPRP